MAVYRLEELKGDKSHKSSYNCLSTSVWIGVNGAATHRWLENLPGLWSERCRFNSESRQVMTDVSLNKALNP